MMKKSGKTPLLRAIKLEKLLNIGEIYLKLEGLNPTGHKYDRVAELLIKDSTLHNFNKILVDGSFNYISSVKYLADLDNISVKYLYLKMNVGK